MEKGITKSHQQVELLTRYKAKEQLTEREKLIAKIIVHVNDLVPFPHEVDTLIRWAQDIEKYLPGIELEKLAFLIDCFKQDKIEWNKSKGIQNIFNGIKEITADGDGYTVRQHINW